MLLVSGKKRVWLRDLNDLRGFVQIRTEQQALQFVRLRTAPETAHLWKSAPRLMEIIPASEIVNIPDFELRKQRPFYPISAWSTERGVYYQPPTSSGKPLLRKE